MLEITIGTNTERIRVLVSGAITLRKLLEDNNVVYTKGTIHIDGCPVGVGDMDKTLTDLGITTKAYIISVVKADNAR